MSTQQPSLLQGIPSLPNDGCCHSCGQKLPRIFSHVLNRGLVSFLWSLYYAKVPTKLVDLPIDKCTFANSQKAAYWSVCKSEHAYWSLTERGRAFLKNEIAIEKRVGTKHGRVVERSEELIKISDVDEGWQSRLDFVREARIA